MPDGRAAFILAGTAFAISVAVAEVLRRLCLRWGILDRPADDRWHRVPRPRLGGAAIFAALVFSVGVFTGHPLARPALALIVGAAFVFAWGLVDDLRRLRTVTKLLLIVVTGMIPPAFGLRFQAPEPQWGAMLAALWVMGVTNAVNWLDNMDGIASGVAVIVAGTLCGLSFVTGNVLGAQTALAIGGAALGFLVLNFPPAKIFMGDCGSGVLGYALATTALLVADTSAPPFPAPILVSALALGVPILDMMLVAVLRALRGRSIFTGGRDHLAHRLASFGLSERAVATVLFAATMLCGVIAVASLRESGVIPAAIIGLGATFLVLSGALVSLARTGAGPLAVWPMLAKIRARYGALVVQAALIGGVLALLYAPIMADLAYQWRVDPEYSHGPLVLLIGAYLVWRRRQDLQRCPSAPSSTGFLVILAGLGLLIVGEAAVFGYFMRVSLLVVVAGAILFLSGPRMLRALAFPLAYLLFMIPLPYIVFDRITLPLQLLASSLATSALDAIGIPALREGNVITLAAAQLGVTEACSGIRSLISLGAIGMIYAYLAFPGWWRQAILVASTIPIAIAANAARVALTGLLADRFGIQAAMGFYHTFSGLLVFALAVTLLVFAGATLSMVTQSAQRRRAHA